MLGLPGNLDNDNEVSWDRETGRSFSRVFLPNSIANSIENANYAVYVCEWDTVDPKHDQI